MESTVDAVEVYWRPGCPHCTTLWKGLERSGIPLREVNIWENPEAAARLREVTDGSEVVPTVFIGERALVGAPAAAVLAAVADLAPHLLPERRQGLRGLLRRRPD
ncbi:MAG: glutaredoxin family protein [Sporichthyaceae bacterium]